MTSFVKTGSQLATVLTEGKAEARGWLNQQNFKNGFVVKRQLGY